MGLRSTEKKKQINIIQLYLIVLTSSQNNRFYIRLWMISGKGTGAACVVQTASTIGIEGETVEIIAIIGQQDLDEWL